MVLVVICAAQKEAQETQGQCTGVIFYSMIIKELSDEVKTKP